jgi:putative ABC transport system permease protein
VGPSGPTAGGSFRSGILWAAGAIAVSVLLLGVVAAVGYLRETVHRRTRIGVLAAVPWEAGLLLLAFLGWRRLDGGGALVTGRALEIQRPSLLLVVFPLLLLAGAGLLGARLFQIAARYVRSRSRRLAAPAYLAVHRVAGGARLALALVAGSALALGIFIQSQAMVRSLRTTVDAKAGIYVGSDVEARIDYQNVVPGHFAFPMTRVVRFPSAGTLSTGGTFDLLALNPASFAHAAYWNEAFAEVPLAELVRRLTDASDGALPVIVAGQAPAGITSIEVDQKGIPIRVVGTGSAFPGMASLRPLVVVDERLFLDGFDGYFNPLSTSQASTELWIKGNAAAIEDALPGLGFQPHLILTSSQVKDIPYITAVIDTFVVLNVLGLVAALLVIAGMLMYLQARERSQVVSYGLSLRMGMTHAAHRRALVSELAAMLGSSYLVGAALAVGASVLVVPMLDPLSVIPPSPLFVAPTTAIGATGVAIALVAWVGGWLTNRRAHRIDLGEVMRLAE